jgi:hypothetical protein
MHRERQQIDLVAVAERTKIKLSLLDGLERDDVSYWPRGIFRRSYLRAYANAIGLDPEPLVREFLERHPDPDEDVATVMSATTLAQGRPPTRLRMLVDTAFEAIARRRQATSVAGTPVPATRPAGDPAVDAGAPSPVARLTVETVDPARELAMTFAGAETDWPAPDGEEAGRQDWPAGDEPWLSGQFDDGAWSSGEELVPAAADDQSDWSDDVDAVPVSTGARAAGYGPDLSGVAQLCTRLACAREPEDIHSALAEAVEHFGAVGLIVWLSDGHQQSLVPVLSAGYPDHVVARLPEVPRDSDTALATAFRTATPSVVDGCDGETGAVTVPILTAWGCTGVLAVELRDGGERQPQLHACAAILAAQLATLVAGVPRAEAISA